MFCHETEIRVRYGESDQMGYVYYGNYALYYEVARADMIRALGYTYNEMEQDGIAMPVVKMQSKYLRPACYDDLLIVKTTIKDIDSLPFITFYHDIFNVEKNLIHKAEVTLIFYNIEKKKRCMPDDKMLYILKTNLNK